MRYAMGRILPVTSVLAVAAVGILGPDQSRSVSAAPGPNEVLVVNPAASPARTTIVGPVAATIANTPAEAIPVSVQGTPSVAVSGAVTIGNGEAQPIPVRDAAQARIPWVGGGQLLIDPGETFESEQFYNPQPGWRLVIENVSIEAFFPAGQVALQATVLASAGGEGATFRFPMPPLPGTSAGFDHFGFVQLTNLNVAGGGAVVAVERNSTVGTGLANVALSGYLIAVD